jgi:MerR family transcriptional regulator, copper efflux regulator
LARSVQAVPGLLAPLGRFPLDLQVDLRVYPGPVTSGYRIKDVADRSGFTAATLRYYEEIGLLPESTRTAGGYRVFDDRTLERLAFIARAKQLGCSLGEIAELTTAWEGGRCGPVQDRLRTAVSEKLASAQQQIVELMTLTTELQRAAATLELHRPDGPCDDHCGCVPRSAIDTSSPSEAVSLVTKPGGVNDSAPIACTLESHSMRGRFDEWQALLSYVVRRDPIVGGVRATFGPATPLDELMRLAAAEHDCCQFFRFAITIDARGIALEASAPDDAMPIVNALFGDPA